MPEYNRGIDDLAQRFITHDRRIKYLESAPIDPWHDVTNFAHGWSAHQPIAYRRDSMGTVYLRGRLIGGLDGQVAFTLPLFYRPSTFLFAIVCYAATNGMATIDILPDGTVTPNYRTGGTDQLSLNGVSFSTV